MFHLIDYEMEITLIDGEKLLDLFIEHEIGIKRRLIELWEVDKKHPWKQKLRVKKPLIRPFG